jgi:AmiR/NasT family two-component response regulator
VSNAEAKGALGTRHQITPAEAFERLRRHARSHNTTVRSIAEAVLALELDL